MNTITRVLLPLLICAVVLSACTNDYGETTTRTYKINDAYTTLEVSSAFEVVMSEAVTEPTVTLPELLFDKLTFEVKRGKLTISLRSLYKEDIKDATVKLPNNPDIRVINASSACSLHLNALTDLQKVKISGASEVNLSGDAGTLNIDLSGASQLNAKELNAARIEGKISGASEADVSACEDINVTLSGASELTYGVLDETCKPSIQCKCTGASTVEKR